MSERGTLQPTVAKREGMSARQAQSVEWSIIALCILALALIFQPFWLPLYSIGAGLVVLGGLAFNLVPLCRPGVPRRKLINAGITVLLLLLIVAGLAIGSAYLYGEFLKSQ
ncbi:MAG: hypothetical protein AB7S71_23105 [Dongiaceae bacterium]|jgi:hypothetical protein